MMKKGLLLPGYACRSLIWENLTKELEYDFNFDLIDWPSDLVNNFHSLENYIDWLENIVLKSEYDFAIGHSMGGLVALHIAKQHPDSFQKVIIIESFVRSPGKFFQNLLMGNCDEQVKTRVVDMLNKEKKRYSVQLQTELRQLDITAIIEEIKTKTIAVYGDRGVNNSEEVIKNLNLPEEVLSQFEVHTINNSCHFPMIENPKDLAAVLKFSL